MRVVVAEAETKLVVGDGLEVEAVAVVRVYLKTMERLAQSTREAAEVLVEQTALVLQVLGGMAGLDFSSFLTRVHKNSQVEQLPPLAERLFMNLKLQPPLPSKEMTNVTFC
jgi:hypothetical protein